MNKLNVLIFGLLSMMFVFSSCSKDEEVLKPDLAFTVSDTKIDAGQTVKFSDLSTNGPTSWAWVFEGGDPAVSSEKNPEVTYNVPGSYAVTLVVANEAGSDELTKTDYITVEAAAPTARFSVSSDRIDPGQDIVLTDESAGNVTEWNWTVTNPDGINYYYHDQEVTITPDVLGYYDVTLEVINEYGSDETTHTACFEVYAPGITFNNTTPSMVKVEYEGIYKYISSDETVKLFDENGDQSITYKVTTQASLGLELSSGTTTVDLSNGDQTVDFEIGSDYFFLTIENSADPFNKEVINAGLQSEVTENEVIGFFQGQTNMGYYNLWGNTNIQCHFMNSNQYVYWENINWSNYGSTNIVLDLVYEGKKEGPQYKITNKAVDATHEIVVLK